MILVHTWEATEKFLSALLAPLKQNADLENMLKVTKWVETLAHPLYKFLGVQLDIEVQLCMPLFPVPCTVIAA